MNGCLAPGIADRRLDALRAGQRGVRAGKNGALFVGHGAFDRADGGLCVRRGRHHHGDEQQRDEASERFDGLHGYFLAGDVMRSCCAE